MREPTRIKLMVTILDKGRSVRATELFSQVGACRHFAILGTGTANSDILDYLGLGETEKDVVLTLLPEGMVSQVLRIAGERLELAVPGKGILFTTPLSGISGAVSQILNREVRVTETEKEEPMQQMKNNLIIAVVNGGCADTVMSAAKSAGARGGTILHGHRLGVAGEKSGESSTLYPEKDIVTILAPKELHQAIMKAVNQAAGITTESHGVVFSVPVDEVLGLSQIK